MSNQPARKKLTTQELRKELAQKRLQLAHTNTDLQTHRLQKEAKELATFKKSLSTRLPANQHAVWVRFFADIQKGTATAAQLQTLIHEMPVMSIFEPIKVDFR